MAPSEAVTAMLEANRPGMRTFMDVLTGSNRQVSLDQLRTEYVDATRAIPVADGVRFERVDIGGVPGTMATPDPVSSGAMTVSIMVMVRDSGLQLPGRGAALSPWANLEHTGRSMTTRDGVDPTTTRAALDAMARTFLAGAPADDPMASPVFADVRGLPPILIQIGGTELMLSDAMRLAEHLGENGVRITLEAWPEMFHV